MIINEAIYAVLDGTGLSTDDFPVSKRFVYNEIKMAREELIKQELNKNSLLDNGSMQAIDSFKFERTEMNDYGLFALVSTLPVPKTIEYSGGVAFFLYLPNGRQVDIVDPGSLVNRDRKRWKLDNFVGYYLRNLRAVLVGYEDVDEMDTIVEGHFTDPEAVTLLNNTDDCNPLACSPVFEYPFMCPALIERRVIEIAKASVLRKLQIPTDSSNNSQFDPNVKSTQEPARR